MRQEICIKIKCYAYFEEGHKTYLYTYHNDKMMMHNGMNVYDVFFHAYLLTKMFLCVAEAI